MRAITAGALIGLGAQLCSLGSSAVGQTPDPACRGVASVALDVRGAAAARASAIGQLGRCPVEAAHVGAQLWSERVRAPELQRALASLSLEWQDQRLFDALIRVAPDPGRPRSDRILALQALLRYVDPALSVAESTLLGPTPGPVDLRSTHSAPARSGTEPPGPDARGRVLRALQGVSTAPGDEGVGRAARFLRQSLAFTYPGETPLAPGAVTLKWDCAGHLELRSTADITLPLVLEMPGIGRTQPIELAGMTAAGASIQRRHLNYAGTVRLRIGPRELASAACALPH